MGGTRRRRASAGNRIGMLVIGVAVAALIVVLIVQSVGLQEKITAYETENAKLQEQIYAEEERSSELENLPAYVASDEYIEKVAREKFGLVYPNETIFKTAD